jgi:hypothetical protein
VDMPKAATMARKWADRAALFPVSIDFAADDGDDAVAVLSVGRKIPVAGRYPRRKGKPAVSSQQDGRGHYRRRRHWRMFVPPSHGGLCNSVWEKSMPPQGFGQIAAAAHRGHAGQGHRLMTEVMLKKSQ